MDIKLFDHEWHYLLQMVNRIYMCRSYEDVCKTVAYQLHTLISYRHNVFFEIDRKNGLPVVKDALSFQVSGDASDSTRFLGGDYPHWSEYIMSTHSNVFRQSDLVPKEKWEKSRVYRDIWLPQNNYWGLFLSVIHNDQPLVLMLFTRPKDKENFNNKDMRIMQILSTTLEQKLSQLKEPAAYHPPGSFEERIADFGFTRREKEIVSLICNNLDTDRICEKIVISSSTFQKHLSNIYNKTGFKNRIQLYNYCNGYSQKK